MTGPIIPDREPTPHWMRYAACRGVDPNMFFPTPTHQGPGGMPPAVFEPAKRICAECPAIKACRNYALADSSLDGIWGGTTENERRRIRRRQARATPKASKTEKWCPTCAHLRPLDEFNLNRARPDGLHGECAVCGRERAERQRAERQRRTA